MPAALPSDGSLAAPFVRLDAERAVAIARELFGVDVTGAQRLDTERDDTFLVRGHSGAFVLKVAHPVDDPAVIDLQSRALGHASRADPALPLPRLVASRSGALQPVVRGAESEPRVARLLTYLPGRTLDYGATTASQRRAIGAAVARLSWALRDFDHPSAGRVLAWDLQRLGTLRPLLPHVPHGAPRDLAAAELDRFDEHVGADLAETRQQVVHQDVNADNLLVDASADGFVTGILDFGDVVRSSVVGDLAVAMSYAVGAGGSLERGAVEVWDAPYDLARGFEEVRPLTAPERRLLPSLVRARLAQRLILNSWLAAADPANAAYTLRSIDQAARSLARLASTPPPRWGAGDLT